VRFRWLLLLSVSLFAAIRGPGTYSGVVIFDRWGGCHLYSGVYVMEIAEVVKESLRPYAGKAITVDALEVMQPMNPGDGLIKRLRVIGAAIEGTRPIVEGIRLRAIPSFPAEGVAEFVIEVRNESGISREIATGELAPTLFGHNGSEACLSPADGPSRTAVTRTSVAGLHRWGGGSIRCGGFFLAPGVALAETVTLAAGGRMEVPLRFTVPAGSYSFLAGYGGGVHETRTEISNTVDFVVDLDGRARLTGRSQALNQVRKPSAVQTVCGRVTLEDGTLARQADVVLWPYPMAPRGARAVAAGTTDSEGAFRFAGIVDGTYVVTATLADDVRVWAGTFRGTRRSDAAPLHVPADAGSCSLVVPMHREPTFTARGKTAVGAKGKELRLVMTEGEAIPFVKRVVVDAGGGYFFAGVPAGRYQLFAGWTGAGIDISGNIDDLGIDIRWPEVVLPVHDVAHNEVMAAYELKSVRRALQAYVETYGNGLPETMAMLGEPPDWSRATAQRAGLLSLQFLSGRGYRFTYWRDEAAPDARYRVSARPTEYGKSGRRSFLIDETGAIRATGADRAATTNDAVLDGAWLELGEKPAGEGAKR
jgi:hypothetical protein